MLRNLDHKVTANFTYREFVKSDTALRLGVNNIPNEEQWLSIEKLVTHVTQPVREEFGRIRITSGFRTAGLCKAIGSSVFSNHVRGEANDIEPLDPKVKLIDILEFIHNELPYQELIAEYFPDGWIHVAYREGVNNKILKLKDKDHNYERVTLDYIKSIYK